MVKYFQVRHFKKLHKRVDREHNNFMENLKILLDLIEEHENNQFDKIVNALGFTMLNTHDIRLLNREFFLTSSPILKNLFGRHLCLAIIEFLEPINSLLGKDLRIQLEQSGFDEFITEVKNINKKFSVLKKQYNKVLRDIRNDAAGHKTIKTSALLKHYTELPIDNKTLVKLAISVTMTGNDFMKVATKILSKISELSENTINDKRLP
jgi:hypothetical protein